MSSCSRCRRKAGSRILTESAYLSHRLYQGTLARMPLGGGAPREILEDVREADWSPDGEQLAIVRSVNGSDRLEFPAGKVLFETPGYVSDLRVSPDGQRVAFFEHPGEVRRSRQRRRRRSQQERRRRCLTATAGSKGSRGRATAARCCSADYARSTR